MKKYFDHLVKAAALMCVVAVIAFVIAVCAGSTQPANAVQETVPTMDYEAAYNDLLLAYNEIAADCDAEYTTVDYEAAYHDLMLTYNELSLNYQIKEADYQRRIDELLLELEQEQLNTIQVEEERDLARTERDEAVQQMDVLREKYSVQYIVVFEIRRKVGFPASEECLSVTIPMTQEEYSQFQESSEITHVIPCLSVPSDSFNVDWRVFVTNTYISTVSEPQ